MILILTITMLIPIISNCIGDSKQDIDKKMDIQVQGEGAGMLQMSFIPLTKMKGQVRKLQY